jgi:hypothetical protein
MIPIYFEVSRSKVKVTFNKITADYYTIGIWGRWGGEHTCFTNISCFFHRSEDEDKPPDYHEATSDLYPESTSEIILDSVNDDPPPPYGLPTYDQAVANKDMESGESKHESETSEGQSLQETSGITSVQEISGSTSTLGPNTAINQSQEQEESLAPGYQDMPHVTI